MLDLKSSFAAALESVVASFPGEDLRVCSWVPAEDFERLLGGIEGMLALQSDQHSQSVLRCYIL